MIIYSVRERAREDRREKNKVEIRAFNIIWIIRGRDGEERREEKKKVEIKEFNVIRFIMPCYRNMR